MDMIAFRVFGFGRVAMWGGKPHRCCYSTTTDLRCQHPLAKSTIGREMAKKTTNPVNKSAHIKRTLKKCALELDPSGQLKFLAEKMFVSPGVFSYWAREGHVPRRKAEWLEHHFPAIVKASSLTKGDADR